MNSKRRSRQNNKRSAFEWSLLALVALAGLLRSVNISDQYLFCDEGVHAATSDFFVSRGLVPFFYFHNPPLKYYWLWFSKMLLGENYFAYRLPSILFGTASVFLLFFLVKKISGKKEIALLASFLLAIDQIHVAFSRVANEEAALSFWVLSAIYLFLLLIERPRPAFLWLTGAVLGLAISTKWQLLPLIPAFFIFFFVYQRKKKASYNYIDLFSLFLYLIIVPLTVYILVYIPWFNRGYTLTEWADLQLIMGKSLSSVENYNITTNSVRPVTWFLMPSYTINFIKAISDNEVVLLSGLTNPLIWLLVLPSFFLLWSQIRKGIVSVLPLLAFSLLYLPLLFASRPVYLYSAMSLIPLACYFVSVLMFSLFKHPKGIVPVTVYLIIASAVFFMLFPFASGIPCPSNFSSTITNFYSLFVIRR